MKLLELIAPCHCGLEAVLKKEILDFIDTFVRMKFENRYLPEHAGTPPAVIAPCSTSTPKAQSTRLT